MHRTTILGFALAMGVLVPTGWHFLGASIEKDGKHLRPLQKTVEIDGVTVKLDVDRAVVMTGDRVTATLVAVSDEPKTISVDLRVLHATNYSGERVERPWDAIDRETIKLVSAPGGGTPVKTALTLGKRPDKLGLEDSFKVMVTAHRAEVPKRQFMTSNNESDFEAMMADGKGAGIAIRGWSGNNLGMKLKAEGPINSEEPFKIAVTIKNTTGHKIDHMPWVSLSTEAALIGSDDDSAGPQPLVEIQRDDASDEDGELARNKSMTRRFIITPHGKLPKTITFLASSNENMGLGPFGAGAMDALTVNVTDSTPSVASK